MAVTRSTVVLYSVVLSLIVAVCVGVGVWFLKPNDNSNYSTTESSVTTTTQNPYEPGVWPVHASEGLIVRTDTGIRVYDGTWIDFRRGFFSAVDYYKNETLYCVSTSNYSPVRSTSRKFPDLKYPGDDWMVNTLAVDDLTNKLYAYDENIGKINVFDLQGKYMGIVLSDLYMVKDIALDLWHGYLFILQDRKILKAGMDGEGLKVIVLSKGMEAFTVDPSNGLLYYSQGQEILVYSYFTGSTYRVALIEGAESIISLSIWQHKLFYATRNSTKVVYTIQSCELGSPSPNGKCVNTETISNPKDNYNPRQLKTFYWWSRVIENPCQFQNGGCEQLCVRADNMNTDKRSTCQCQVGWQLNLDAKTCSPVSEYLMYVRGFHLRGNILDLKKESFVDATVPFHLNMDSLQHKKLIDFDANAHKGYFIFTDDYSMWRVNLLWTQQQGRQKMLDTTLQYRMYPVVDWVADQIYYLRTRQFSGGNEAYLMVRRPDVRSPFESQGIVHKFKETEKPGALVVDPNLGCLYFTVYDTSKKKVEIYRINSDGSGLKTFEVNDVSFSVNETSLAYDYSSRRLYWFTKDKTQIQHANFEGADLVTFNIAQISEPRSINVHREWIYVNNQFSLWRFLKEAGEFSEQILSKPGQDEQQRMSAAKGYGANLQPIRENHPCAINKGGCEVYCFGVPVDEAGKVSLKKVCGCNQNQKLQDDKKSCKYNANWQEES